MELYKVSHVLIHWNFLY